MSQAGIGVLGVAATAWLSWILLECSSADDLAAVSDIPECANDMAWVVSLDWLGLPVEFLSVP